MGRGRPVPRAAACGGAAGAAAGAATRAQRAAADAWPGGGPSVLGEGLRA